MRKPLVVNGACQKIACALILLLVSAGCAVKWTPLYDDTLDKDATALQQSVETYLTGLKDQSKPACLYQQNLAFFQKSSVQLALMQTRVNASVHAAQLQEIIQSLKNTISDLQKLQQADEKNGNCMNDSEIEDTRAAFEREFEAMLAYELALKANQPPSTGPAASPKK